MITIERMKENHVPQIATLEKSIFSDPWSENSVKSELSNPLSLWLVAADGETVAGYIGSQTVLGESDMMNLAVRESYRRSGVGRALVEALIEALRAVGSECLTLEVRFSNLPAIRLYESLGFSQVGIRKNYYEKPREDARIFKKEWSL